MASPILTSVEKVSPARTGTILHRLDEPWRVRAALSETSHEPIHLGAVLSLHSSLLAISKAVRPRFESKIILAHLTFPAAILRIATALFRMRYSSTFSTFTRLNGRIVSAPDFHCYLRKTPTHRRTVS